MVTARLHGGPHDGETVEMPWARLEMRLLRWTDNFIEDMLEDVYRLRPPWRGQELAHYDFVDPESAAEARQAA
jgi:hypothetical protein